MSNYLNTMSVLILAGGQSARMGEDKALIEVNHQPLLQRVCHVAVTVSSAVYILTPWPERYQTIVPAHCQFIPESQPNQGPLVALANGLKTLNTDWVLLLACDLPFLDPTLLQQWIKLLDQVPQSTLAVVPYHASRWQPLCGFYRRQCEGNLQRFIQQGGRSFQQWLPQIEVYSISIDPTQELMLLNCNTPTELERIRYIHGQVDERI
jgi:molybdopterin-guanine dinucleotide biosynthesis protein A